MVKFKLLPILLCFLVLVFCSEDDKFQAIQTIPMFEIEDLLNVTDSLFEQINVNVLDEEMSVISFEIFRHPKTEEVALVNFKEEGYFPILGASYRVSGSDYTITCSDKISGNIKWEKNCSGAVSCGKLAKKCLDEGGCATVCINDIFYDPNNDFNFLLKRGVKIDLIKKVLPYKPLVGYNLNTIRFARVKFYCLSPC